jgi:hypothetical protein
MSENALKVLNSLLVAGRGCAAAHAVIAPRLILHGIPALPLGCSISAAAAKKLTSPMSFGR